MIDPKTEAWRTAAHNVITELAKANTHIVSDMVIAALEETGNGLNNYSALGGVFTRAAKAGLIVKTGDTQRSRERNSHSAKIVWKSLVYSNGIQVSPELAAVSAMITNNLAFNAATIRNASLIFAAGTVEDRKQLQQHIDEFKKLEDQYIAQHTRILDDLAAQLERNGNDV
jgi:hypothetical protein